MEDLSKLSFQELKDFLDAKALQYEHRHYFLQDDPIQLPHRFERKEDIEIVAFLVSIIAWGNRQSIIKSGERLLQILGPSPLEYVLNYQDSTCPPFIHRTFNTIDLNGFLMGLQYCYANGGLEAAFDAKSPLLYNRIIAFRERFVPFLATRSHKHIANPAKGAAAKRIIMFLRWMCRPASNGVDFGLWKNIDSKDLMIPLDVHTGNISRKLGLLQRTQNDWQANTELQAFCLRLDPVDPAKYDFALFGLGAYEKFA